MDPGSSNPSTTKELATKCLMNPIKEQITNQEEKKKTSDAHKM